MELLNIVGLLLIAATNAWIAVQVRNQKTYNKIEVMPAEICYDSLATAMENSWPTVTVSNDVTIDYDKLATALSKIQITPTVVVAQPNVIPNPNTGPYWQTPIVSGGQIDCSSEQEYYTINDGTKVPVRQFPTRRVNGRGDADQ